MRDTGIPPYSLTAQAARAELDNLGDELVRDQFISKMKNTVLHDTLSLETFSPIEVLERALKFQQSKQKIQAFQKSLAATASAGQFAGSQVKIKQ